MASQLAVAQLSRQLTINAPGFNAPALAPVPNTVPLTVPRVVYPPYNVGYALNNPPDHMPQYIPPRPPHGQSSNHTFSMLLGEDLHPILFQMDPHPSDLYAVQVPVLVDAATGLPETGVDGGELRYFSHLPRYVAWNVSGALMETWIRLDPRVQMFDIINRVNPRPTFDMQGRNAFFMKRQRFRESIGNFMLGDGRQNPSASEVENVLPSLTRENFLLNTAMVVDLPNQRLLKPSLRGNTNISKGYIDSGLPLDYFLQGFPQPVANYLPSDRQMTLIDELRRRYPGGPNGAPAYARLNVGPAPVAVGVAGPVAGPAALIPAAPGPVPGTAAWWDAYWAANIDPRIWMVDAMMRRGYPAPTFQE